MNGTNKNLLFIQGGGSEEDYAADKKLVDSLQQNLGEAYSLHYPSLPNESVPDFGRIKQIGNEISLIGGEVILVGHSLGASMLLKYVSENEMRKKPIALFLISTPFWSGDEDWKVLSCRKILLINYPGTFPFFFTTARMMRKCRLHTLPFTGKSFPGRLSAN